MKTVFKTRVSYIIATSIAAAFVICSLPANAQNRYSKKLYAYKEIRSVTNIFINDTTHRGTSVPDTHYLIYIELSATDTSIWHTAIIAGDTYAVHSTLIAATPLVIGERKMDKRLVTIRPQPGNRLWKLEFDLTEEKTPSIPGTNAGPVVLKGTFKNRKVTSTVSRIVELGSP